MLRQWVALVIIVMLYIPVAIDATVLHVAVPTLSMTLNASGNQLLWIIDIYSLVMAGMVLFMGALGDRIGFKRLLITGSLLFGLSSLAAALAPSAAWLIATRASLAIGAAMIIPATLAGIRTLFVETRDRNIALGVWAAVGSGGAAFGPLLGGAVLEHYDWGAIFFINVPLVVVMVALAVWLIPGQPGRTEQKLNLPHALLLIVAILLLVYSAKTALKGDVSPSQVTAALIAGAAMLALFIRLQRQAEQPMIDVQLFRHRIILSGVVMALTAMIALVGFELLMAQELQFVHGFTPFEAGKFMLPVMIASGFSGPIAGILVGKLGLRPVAVGGMGFSGISFLGLSMLDFSTQQWQAWSLMVLLGFSASSALLASTSAIMAAAPKEKAAAAGAIETLSYELGAGLGIALFGLLLTRSFTASIVLPSALDPGLAEKASSSIGEAINVAQTLEPALAGATIQAAKAAFIASHSVALVSAAVLLLLLAAGIGFSLAKRAQK